MYLSIGDDFSVRKKSIIGIFDLDNTTTSGRTHDPSYYHVQYLFLSADL